jgi:ABC-type dipeptide/oligopeptide/nickel transport system ATPase component
MRKWSFPPLPNLMGTSLLLITHNRGVVAATTASRVVMYADQVMEGAFAANLSNRPFHSHS